MGMRGVSSWLVVAAGMMLAACSTLSMRDPPNVTVAGFQPLQGQGFEMRMIVKLRVQNPNDSQIDYNGVSVSLDVQDKTFATGVSDQAGSVPRFGEAVIEVPVTISAMNMARQALGALGGGGKSLQKIDYVLNGKLHGSTFSSVKFKTAGSLDLPSLPKPGAAGTAGT
jgi:LEA14-like dessication related protein